MDILKILLFAPVSIYCKFQFEKLNRSTPGSTKGTYIQYIKNNFCSSTTKKTTKKSTFKNTVF